MRTVAGLITGLALGILLMYFSLSTVEVGRLTTPQPGSTPAVHDADAALARRLGAASGQAAAAAVAEAGTILAVADPAEPLATAALEGFRDALSEHPGITLLAVATPAEAAPHLGTARGLFCPDHRDLQRLCDGSPEGPLPPTWTLGWSAWLLDTVQADCPPVAGVAVPHPAAALRQLTLRWDGDDTDAPAPAVTVLTPTALQAAFALTDHPAAAAGILENTPRTQGVP